MHAPRLGPRLRAVLDLLDDGPGVIHDIGCDHGALVAALLGRGRQVVGLELRPHLVAELRARGLPAALADGFVSLEALPQAAQAVIAGLGEDRLIAFLDRDAVIARRCRRIVLCPSAPRGLLRPWLAANAWRIVGEREVQDRRRRYQVLAVASVCDPAPQDWGRE